MYICWCRRLLLLLLLLLTLTLLGWWSTTALLWRLLVVIIFREKVLPSEEVVDLVDDHLHDQGQPECDEDASRSSCHFAYKTFFSFLFSFLFLLLFQRNPKFFFPGKKAVKRRRNFSFFKKLFPFVSILLLLLYLFVLFPKKQKLGRSVHQLSSSSHGLKTHIPCLVLCHFLISSIYFILFYYFIHCIFNYT